MLLFQRILLLSAPSCLRCLSICSRRTLVTFSKSDGLERFGRRNFNDQSIFNINTNVPRDVLLYKSPSDKTYKMISIFSVVQFGFWLTVADTYNKLLNEKPELGENSRSISWLDSLKEKGRVATVGIPVGCLCMGAMLIGICFVYTMKSVKMLVLCKGGDELSITSFGFFNRNVTMTIPLENISCSVSRNSSGQTIPLKVKGKWFHYTLDKNGEIYNTKLFDLTAGMRRNNV